MSVYSHYWPALNEPTDLYVLSVIFKVIAKPLQFMAGISIELCASIIVLQTT